MVRILILSCLIQFIIAQHIDLVVVKKSKRELYLYSNGKIIKKYNIKLGGNPVGPKIKEGDKKTPEGEYLLDYKNPTSRFYKAIHISYPNEQDLIRATKLGVKAGGNIMIHGQVNSKGDAMIFFKTTGNWTAGCIALSNKDMDELWNLINIPTPIKIEP